MIAVGVMSGTSCDGADAVAIELASVEDPHEPVLLAHAYEPYPDDLRRSLLAPAELRAPELAELHFALAEMYARTALRLGVRDVAVAGMHGQTVWHAPPSKSTTTPCTLQIGSSAVLAARLGVPIVGDFRGADIALGGEGAPIVPFAHWFFTPPAARPRMVVNVGGIANVTIVRSSADDVRGYDVGPGMMIADAFARRASNGALDCDRDGQLSRGGSVVRAVVDRVVGHPFVSAPSPKSTGREDFGAAFFEPLFAEFEKVAAADMMTSIVAATGEIVARVAAREGVDGGEILLTGGGARNPTLLRALRRASSKARVVVAEKGVFAPAHHEPAAMALIAARTLSGLPSSLPGVTGARKSAVLGHVHRPS